MRAWKILVAMVILISMARAACGNARTVRDRELHRSWRVERDCTHPERPAILVEVPWSASVERQHDSGVQSPNATPLVRAGMRVALTWEDKNSAGTLSGTALTTAGAGQTVRVRIQFGAAILYAVVRGPGWVELEPRKVGK